LRDVAGHVVWGQKQLQHWVTGEQNPDMAGAPGAPHPGSVAGADPLAAWRAARAACVAVVTPDALDRRVSLPGLGDVPLGAVVELLITDHLAHAWDIGHPLGLSPDLDADLVARSLAWARDNVVRVPGFFGPELTPPDGAGETSVWLAYLGRADWRPAAERRAGAAG